VKETNGVREARSPLLARDVHAMPSEVGNIIQDLLLGVIFSDAANQALDT
jgi:hypothetical protein